MTMERFMKKRGSKVRVNPEIAVTAGGRKGLKRDIIILDGPEVRIKTKAEIEEENARNLEELKRQFGIE